MTFLEEEKRIEEEYLLETNKILDDMGFVQTTKGIPSTVEELDAFRIEVEKRINQRVREVFEKYWPKTHQFSKRQAMKELGL